MSRFMGRVARPLLVALAVAAALSAGCLVSRTLRVHTEGKKLSDTDLAMLQEGKTTREQVEGMFGTPTKVLTPAPGREVLLYVYKSEEQSDVGVFLVYKSVRNTTQVITYRFEFADGVLTRFSMESTG